MIRTLHRTRGASALGARHPGETGPFGPYGAGEDDGGLDDEQAAHPDTAAPTRATHRLRSSSSRRLAPKLIPTPPARAREGLPR